MVPLQLLDATGPVGLVLALVVTLLVVALGSYLGVLLALQAFFEASSWEEAVGDAPD